MNLRAYIDGRGRGACAELAAQLGVTRNTISRYLSGAFSPSLERRRQIFAITNGAVTDWNLRDDAPRSKRSDR